MWQKEIDDLAQRRRLIAEGGDPERIARQHSLAKLTIRERVEALADPGSFYEVGGLAGSEVYDDDKLVRVIPRPIVIGSCTLNKRKVVISGHDSTVRHDAPVKKGAHPPSTRRWSFSYAETLASRWRIPFIRILDAPGASVKHYETTARPEFVSTNQWIEVSARLLAEVPVVSAVMGSIAGMPAIEACLCHFNLIGKGTGHVFPGGPPVVKAALGQDIHKEELGGWRISTNTGVIDRVFTNEEEAFNIIKRFLSYMPRNVWEMPPHGEPADVPLGRGEGLLSAIPRSPNDPYNPHEILNMVLDRDSFFEIAPLCGHSRITALARVSGYPVGVIITDPTSPLKGRMDVATIEKVMRLLQLCDTFHLPLVCFVDEPGFWVGPDAEQQGVERAAARLVQIAYRTKMPWISFIMRRVCGTATSLAFRPHNMGECYAWPSAAIGSMHVEAGTVPPHSMTGMFGIQDVIDPRDTRPILGEFLENAQGVLKTQLGPNTGPSYRL